MARRESDYDKLKTMLGMLAKNSSWDHNNEGLPSDPQMVDMISQQFANDFAREFDNITASSLVWNGTTDGYMIFIGIIYRMFHSYVAGLWDYNDDFLNALGMSKYKFEDMLLQSGKLALFYDGEGEKRKLFALPFTEKTRDVYGDPINITIDTTDSKYFNGKPLKKGDYIVIKQNDNGWNKLVENAPFLWMAYEAACELHDDIPRGQKHYIMLADSAFDNTAAITTDILSDFSTNRKTVLALNPQPDSNVLAADPTAKRGRTLSEKFKDALLSLEYTDRSDQDFETYRNVLGEAFKYLGIDINANPKKRERQITGEISIEAEIPRKIRQEMFAMREYALKKANELWNNGKDTWTITMNEEEDIQPMETPSPLDDSEGEDE